MGDFLSELIARNNGTADVLAPRRAARFETVQEQGTLGFQTGTVSFEPEAFVEENTRESPLPQTRMQRTHKAQRNEKDSKARAAPALPRSQSEPQLPDPMKAQAHVPPATEEFEARSETINPQPSLSRTSSPAVARQDAPRPVLQRPGDAREQINQEQMVEQLASQTSNVIQSRHDELESSSVKAHSSRNAEAPDAIVATPRVTLAEQRSEESAAPQTVGSKAKERAPAPLTELVDVQSSAPTINVTIGRVEVRAVSSAASPNKTHTTAPTLSLDEYLRKRRQGGER